jgi:hypothetical protein
MRRRRLNPSAEQERRAAEVMRDPDLDLDAALDLANRILAGEEVAYALAGTGLVVDTSPRPAQIAEVETAQGVVEVPVKEAPAALSAKRDPVADAVQAIDALRHAAQTARRQAETEGLRERAAQILAGLSVSDLKQVAQHYNVYLQRVPADRRVEKIVEGTVGWTLRSRAVRGDYEEDEEARVRERDEQTQMQIDAYRRRHGLPPAPRTPSAIKAVAVTPRRP